MSCNCGCGGCQTKIRGPLLIEGKVKSLLSEGLQYHIDKKIPLFETVYRIGSDKHLSLIKEARKMYSRNVIDLCEEDEALIKTHLGEFALYEGESVPLDLPMLEEQPDSKYPNFDLNKNIKYQDTSISSGMWRYTGTEQGGKGVYRNLNNGQILAFDRSDFDIFKNNLSSHFDIDEATIKERIVNILEAKKKKAKKKDNRPIGKPMRSSSGGKAYKVYVKDPKTKKIKTVRFGSGGLRAKINDSKARAAFAARHKCSSKKDRTKAGYWSCRLPRYAKLLGLKSSFSGFW